MSEVVKGIDSLKKSVMSDCAKGENCFSENGCTKERYLNLPETDPTFLKMGFKTKCISNTKCSHDYCGKYKWVMDRAKHYAEKTGKTVDEILIEWETRRSYWYMNYYQDSNQPLIEGDNIVMYDDWIKELKERFGEDSKNWAFVCPSCKNIQTAQDFIDNGQKEQADNVYFNCIGRYVENKGCDWTLGGLLKINTKTVIKDGTAFPVFEMAPEPLTEKHVKISKNQ